MLNIDAKYPWLLELRMVQVEGNDMMNEYDFIHTRSKTLIVADLLTNIKKHTPGLNYLSVFLLTILRVYCQCKPGKNFLLYTDREKIKESCFNILDSIIERVMISHGELIEDIDVKDHIH